MVTMVGGTENLAGAWQLVRKMGMWLCLFFVCLNVFGNWFVLRLLGISWRLPPNMIEIDLIVREL